MKLRLCEWQLTLAGIIDAERDELGRPATYTAHERFANVRGLRLNKWGAGPFVRLRPPPLPKVPGLYAVTSNLSGEPLYIGIASANLFARWGRGGYSVIDPRNCYIGGQSTNCHINGLITQELIAGRRLSLWFLEAADPRPIELVLIRTLRPPWNIQH